MSDCCRPGIMPPDLYRPLTLSIKKGESLGFAFTLYQSGEPQNLSGFSIVLQVRETPEDNGNYLINKTISTTSDPDADGLIDQPYNGNFFFKINAGDIAGMSTLRPYYLAIFTEKDNSRHCISAAGCEIAKFLVLNP